MPKSKSHETSKDLFPAALTEVFDHYEDVRFARDELKLLKVVSKKIHLPMKLSNRTTFFKWLKCSAMQEKIKRAFENKKQCEGLMLPTEQSQEKKVLKQYPAFHRTQKLPEPDSNLSVSKHSEGWNLCDLIDPVPLIVTSNCKQNDSMKSDEVILTEENWLVTALSKVEQIKVKQSRLPSGMLRKLICLELSRKVNFVANLHKNSSISEIKERIALVVGYVILQSAKLYEKETTIVGFEKTDVTDDLVKLLAFVRETMSIIFANAAESNETNKKSPLTLRQERNSVEAECLEEELKNLNSSISDNDEISILSCPFSIDSSSDTVAEKFEKSGENHEKVGSPGLLESFLDKEIDALLSFGINPTWSREYSEGEKPFQDRNLVHNAVPIGENFEKNQENSEKSEPIPLLDSPKSLKKILEDELKSHFRTHSMCSEENTNKKISFQERNSVQIVKNSEKSGVGLLGGPGLLKKIQKNEPLSSKINPKCSQKKMKKQKINWILQPYEFVIPMSDRDKYFSEKNITSKAKIFLRSQLRPFIDCPFEFGRCYVYKTVSIYFHCKHPACLEYKLRAVPFENEAFIVKIYATERTPGTNPELKMLHLPDEHGKVIQISEECRGDLRKESLHEIQSISGEQYNNKKIKEIETNPEMLKLFQAGNSTQLMSESAARKLKQESMSRQDRHKNNFQDLLIQVKDEKEVASNYIQKLREYPFNIVLLSERQIQILNDARLVSELTAHIDATGQLVKKTDDDQQRIFLYSTVIPLRPQGDRFKDQAATETPVCEMLSETHGALDVHEWQFFFKRKIQKQFPKYRKQNIFGRFVVDFSYALIYGILDAWNNMDTLTEYLDYTHDLIRGTTRQKSKVSFIHICGVHILKKMIELINKTYANSDFVHQKEYNKKLKCIIGVMFSIQNYDELLEYWENVCIILTNPLFDSRVTQALKYFKYFEASKQEILDNIIENEYKIEKDKALPLNDNENIQDDIDDDDKSETFKTIYESSKFYKDFLKIFNSVIENNIKNDEVQEQERNIFFSLDMANQFMKKYGTYAPMWTGVLWKFSKIPLTKIPHNNDVECYFGGVKKETDEASTKFCIDQ
jgi:hypothetical protein